MYKVQRYKKIYKIVNLYLPSSTFLNQLCKNIQDNMYKITKMIPIILKLSLNYRFYIYKLLSF
jgi:hypothetical protein